MDDLRRKSLTAAGALLLTGFLVTLGTVWAVDRGSPDFHVFFHAWRLVLEGRGTEIYSESPDRFLYAPGFAWLLAPIAALPFEFALLFWCLAKTAVLGLLVRGLAFRLRGSEGISALAMAGLAALFVARPILIDFQYGQVNLFILGAAFWGLSSRMETARPPEFSDFLRWWLMGVAAVAKLIAFPVLLVPFLVSGGLSKSRLQLERTGVLAGALLTVLVPVLSVGISGILPLHRLWRDALVAKGLPLETHNQSFAALAHHFLGGEPTHVIFRGSEPLSLGLNWLTAAQIHWITLAWTLVSAGLLLGWIFSAPRREPLSWACVLIGLLILPGHLVWKPYFVFGLPAAALAIQKAARAPEPVWRALLILLAFLGMNLSGYEVVGAAVATWLEAGSVMLLAHLLLLSVAARE